MRRSDIFFAVLSLATDYVMLICAGLLAYTIRFHPLVIELRPVIFSLPFSVYFSTLLGIALIWLLVFSLAGLYTIPQPKRFIDNVTKIFLGSTGGFLFITVWMFIQRELFDSRFIILIGWTLAFFLVAGGRFILRTMRQVFHRHSYGLEQALLVGDNGFTHTFAKSLLANKHWGILPIKTLPMSSTIVQELQKELTSTPAESVIITDPHAPQDIIEHCMVLAHDAHKNFYYAADVFDAHLRNIDIITVMGTPLIHIKRTPLDGWGRVFKRAFDILFSLIILTLLAPLFGIVALWIKIDSSGPVCVKLKRVGVHGKPFLVYKFRSMVKNAHEMKKELLEKNEREGPLFKMKHDPRITRLGKWLRLYSIDEFPQFYNVLKGDMSIVGPRPHEPEEVEHYEHHHKRVHSIKPGITGLAQISGRSSLAFEEEVRLDMYYIENWSLTLDIGIILKTPWVIILRKNVA